MRNAKLYLTAKTVHRYFVLITLVTGILMALTGICIYAGQYFIFDAILIRYVHNKLSILFTVVLGIMMVTGTYLFLFPYFPMKNPVNDIKKRQQERVE